MQFRLSNSVRAFLPAIALAFCHGCGGGGGGGAATTGTQGSTPTPAPAPAPAPSTPNQAPIISADGETTAHVGVAYEFQPAASDPENDKLTFSAENLPPWASFDSSSGVISGTPGASDVGEYEAITITVADAARQSATKPFSITVVGGGSGVATLAWETPPAKCDGSPLDDLAGYRIVYGRNADDLDHSIFIDDPAQTAYAFSTLDEGIWYFAVIAVNANGLEGPPSTAAMKSI
jgi:hypothetical protein